MAFNQKPSYNTQININIITHQSVESNINKTCNALYVHIYITQKYFAMVKCK